MESEGFGGIQTGYYPVDTVMVLHDDSLRRLTGFVMCPSGLSGTEPKQRHDEAKTKPVLQKQNAPPKALPLKFFSQSSPPKVPHLKFLTEIAAIGRQ